MKTTQTPAPKLGAALGLANELWLKREDKHKYGSHKGRSIPLMIAALRQEQGANRFAISSSGNAALAAGLYIKSHNRNKPHQPLKLKIYVGNKIDKNKLTYLKKEVESEHTTIEQVENPKQQAFLQDKEGRAKLLRQSTSAVALTGYYELATELAKIPDLQAIFVPTSTGTTAVGLYQGFKELEINPQIHIIQTTAVHPLVDKTTSSKENSVATAIVDLVANRKEEVLEALKNSHGAGWVATNEQINEAKKLVKENTDIQISPNSALSVVGLKQAIMAGTNWNGPVVCLITGQ